MNKIIKNSIIFILIFMTILNGIVPCTVLADERELLNFEGYTLFKFNSELKNRQHDENGLVPQDWIKFNQEVYVYDDGRAKPIDEIFGSGEVYNIYNGEYYYNFTHLTDFQLVTKDYENLTYTLVNPMSYNPISEPKKVSRMDSNLVTTVSGKELNDKAAEDRKKNMEQASFFEHIITIFFVTLGDGAMWAIQSVCGSGISLDKLFFNEYSNTALSIFKYSEDEYTPPNMLENGLIATILPSIENVYKIFSGIAAATFLTSLLYIGLKILFSSTGSGKAKYQEYLVTWVKGAVILAIFPYVMKMAIKVNCALVYDIKQLSESVLGESSSEMPQMDPDVLFDGIETAIEFGGMDTRDEAKLDLMGKLRYKATDTGKLAYAICWLILIGELVKFLFMYFKRVLMTIFLVSIFPLVTMTYVIDKVGDGKSQAFDRWVKEYMLNVFVQAFHALNYVLVLGIISAISELGASKANYILILVAITYISKGEGILRSIFGQTGGVGTVKNATESVLKTTAAVKIVKNTFGGLNNKRKSIVGLMDTGRKWSDERLKDRSYKLEKKNDDLTAKYQNEGNPLPPIEAYHQLPISVKNSISSNLDIINNYRSSEEQIKNAAINLSQYKDDPVLQRLVREKNLSWDAVVDLIAESEALEQINKNVNVDVRNNFDVVINRKTKKMGYYAIIGNKLLRAYGFTDEKVMAERNKYNNDDNIINTLNVNNQQRFVKNGKRKNQKGSNNSKAPSNNGRYEIVYEDGTRYYKINDKKAEELKEKRQIKGYIKLKNEGRINARTNIKLGNVSNTDIRTNKKAKSNAGTVMNEKAKSNTSDPNMRAYSNTVKYFKTGKSRQQIRTNKRLQEIRKGLTLKNGKYVAAEQNPDEVKRFKRVATGVAAATIAQSQASQAHNALDEIRYEGGGVRDTGTRVWQNHTPTENRQIQNDSSKETSKGKAQESLRRNNKPEENKDEKRKTQAKKSRERQEMERRRRLADDTTKEAIAIDKAPKRSYSYRAMAETVEEMNGENLSTYEKILARKDFETEAERVVSSAVTEEEKAKAAAAIETIRRRISFDDKTQQTIDSINIRVENEKAEKIAAGETVSEEMEKDFLDKLAAYEILSTGRGTLKDLWDALHICEKEESKELNAIASSNISMEVYAVNLAVETLNNIDEITEGIQPMVDEAIRVIKRYRNARRSI